MNKTRFLLFTLLIIGIITVFVIYKENSTISDRNGINYLDVSYGNDSQQKYDIYLPKNASTKSTKVIIYIHGGSWTNGDKANAKKLIRFLIKSNPDFTVVSMNYRLAEIKDPIKPAFPNQFLDVGLVINHIKSQQNNYQIKPEFGLIGTSAGAHLALMYDYFYDKENDVKMVCSLAGPTDLTDKIFIDNPNFKLYSNSLIDSSKYSNNTNLIKAISPVFYASITSSPTLLMYGDNDLTVPLSNGKRLSEVLNNLSVKNKLIVYKGGHGDYWDSNFENNIKDFISKHFSN